ncbi:MAG: gamma-glutamyl-gamma-aminobutyrate hydrolase family protein [Allobranchiibius sp.]
MTSTTGRRPLILIPARFSASAAALRYRAEVTAEKLVRAVYDAGGEPLVLHPDVPAGLDSSSPAGLGLIDRHVRDRIGMADGILLPGGGDLAARWAGQQSDASEYDVDEDQDVFDLALARVAIQDGIPLLAICRGTQVVNVALGGDLVQDLSQSPGGEHRNFVHTFDIDTGSALAQLIPGKEVTISCFHHQGLGRLGRGVRVDARAVDGTIEAIALEDQRGWFLGVQWHPEDTAATDPQQASVFTAFVAAARSQSLLSQ